MDMERPWAPGGPHRGLKQIRAGDGLQAAQTWKRFAIRPSSFCATGGASLLPVTIEQF